MIEMKKQAQLPFQAHLAAKKEACSGKPALPERQGTIE